MVTVLIAEPEPCLRDAYTTFFSELGCRIQVATNGLDCLSILRKTVPDLLILDLDLLWGGAAGVLAVLQQDTQFPSERVVVTAPVDARGSLETLASTFGVQTLTKPFPVNALIDNAAKNAPSKSRTPWTGRWRRGVLIVDDDKNIRELLRTRLERDGFRAWAAGSGEEALVLCKEFADQLAVIVLDIQMPGLTGPETFDEIAKIDADIPVCFMTADLGIYELEDLLQRGARYVFAKPFQMTEFADIVRTLAEETNGLLQYQFSSACTIQEHEDLLRMQWTHLQI
jgi:CheY-like chemotaxis protein